MTHRGACGCESNTGDGAGCLVAIPHGFFARVVREDCDVRLPDPEQYAVGHLFLPKEPELYNAAKGIVAKCAPSRPSASNRCSLLVVLLFIDKIQASSEGTPSQASPADTGLVRKPLQSFQGKGRARAGLLRSWGTQCWHGGWCPRATTVLGSPPRLWSPTSSRSSYP